MIDLRPHGESGNGENWVLGQEHTIQLNHSYRTVNHSNNTIKCAKGRLAPSNTLRVGLEPIAEIISGVWCGNSVEIISIIQLKCCPFKHNPK